MSELDQLKTRIDNSGTGGIKTSIIRDDYEPAGDLMIHNLLASGQYVARKVPPHSYNAKWTIFKSGAQPY